jgi:hypothetical protein
MPTLNPFSSIDHRYELINQTSYSIPNGVTVTSDKLSTVISTYSELTTKTLFKRLRGIVIVTNNVATTLDIKEGVSSSNLVSVSSSYPEVIDGADNWAFAFDEVLHGLDVQLEFSANNAVIDVYAYVY